MIEDTTIRDLIEDHIVRLLLDNYAIVEITPDLARELLEFNNHNRKLDRDRVKSHTAAILEGRWYTNPGDKGITFTRDADNNPLLMDGQHRLWAIVKADKPITAFIAWDIDKSVMDYTDTGKPRRLTDLIDLALDEPSDDTNQIKSIGRWLYYWEEGYRTPHRSYAKDGVISKKDILVQRDYILERYDEIEAAVPKSRILRRTFKVPNAAGGVAYILLKRVDSEAADIFWNYLISDQDMSLSLTSPITLCKIRLRKHANGDRDSFMWDSEQFALILHAWNLWRKGKTQSKIEIPAEIPEPI